MPPPLSATPVESHPRVAVLKHRALMAARRAARLRIRPLRWRDADWWNVYGQDGTSIVCHSREAAERIRRRMRAGLGLDSFGPVVPPGTFDIYELNRIAKWLVGDDDELAALAADMYDAAAA